MRNNSVKLFSIWTSGSGGNVIKRHFLSRPLAAPLFVGAEPFVQFGRRHHEEQFCKTILNLDQWSRRCRLKIFLIWSSGSPFVKQSGIILAFLGEGIKRINSVKLFWIWTSGSGGMPFKDISYLELWQPFFSVEQNHKCNFSRGYQKEEFCEFNSNLG